jgi:D-glycerate 3-kinase
MQWQDVSSNVSQFILEQQLPTEFIELSEKYFFPLAQQIVVQQNKSTQPLLLGINGAQGTGKSTLAALLKCILQAGKQWQCAILSIDDLYLTRAERENLAKTVHPLLQVRGVPGTHDINLGLELLDKLRTSQTTISLPHFDKAIDDRKPYAQWPQQQSPIKLIILEGWCIGAHPQAQPQLDTAINVLEAQYDTEKHWRHYVNQQLATQYQTLFSQLDYLVMLKAPTMEAIEEWRWLQEQKLIAATQGKGRGLMNREQVKTFIQHYERLTRHMLAEMPTRADWVFYLNDDHKITHASGSLIPKTTAN